MINVFAEKSTPTRRPQPWADVLAFGSNIASFYQSRGDATIIGHEKVATILDGPEKVVLYENLTVGDGTTPSSLTATQRCKGLTIIVRGNLTVKNNASINMTGKGARVDRADDPRFPFIDFLIPNKVSISSEVMHHREALGIIKKYGFAPWDRGLWEVDGAGLLGVNVAIAEPGEAILLEAAGCGIPDEANLRGYNGEPVGKAGGAGKNGAPGAGGTGGVWSAAWSMRGRAGRGCPYSGGAGSGGVHDYGSNWSLMGHPASRFSGPGSSGGGGAPATAISALTVQQPGERDSSPTANPMYGCGGAGNPGGPKGYHAADTPGGDGCGGKLVIICYGNIIVETGGKIEANGMPGGSSASTAAGGGSGGGHVSIIYRGTLTNNGTIQAAGGPGGDGYSTADGGAGGAGCVVTKTFPQMGTAWV
ncbi:MAG: hypothetical protein HY795_04485 [Desulfovibrio sp.]|nr:hypothetical protein [Desulfovibrio sp.]MBI4960429.1 hypothetical protein [Desulfovibrio sp.]